MTNDEISKWLMNLKDDIGKTQYQPLWHYAEALDMAINALTAQPDSKETSSTHKALDTISRQDAIEALKEAFNPSITNFVKAKLAIENLPSALLANKSQKVDKEFGELISRQAVIDALTHKWDGMVTSVFDVVKSLPSAQPEQCKFEYHYDHTDCIWYRPEARNRCPVTCAQYRDGWNDAMNYIFRDGKGYRPYRRDKQYGE